MNQKSPSPEGDSRNASDVSSSPLSLAVRWFREKVAFRSEESLRDIIEEALEENSDEVGGLSAEEKSLLKNMIHFGELTVHDIMVPRSDIMAVSHSATLAELKQHIVTIGHTRVPVYEDSLDHIAGFVHVKDLFPHIASEQPFDMRAVLREILFIPPSMRIVDLLLKMRVSGCHIAIVVDEFGGTDGMVTMEDLFEELVGEIQDEHDGHEAAPTLRWQGDHVLEVDARTPVEKLVEVLGESLIPVGEGEDVDTLGGLIFSRLGRVPVRGEVVMLKASLKAEILIADPRRIRLVRLTRITL